MTVREALTVALACIDDSRSLEKALMDNAEIIARYDEAERMVKSLVERMRGCDDYTGRMEVERVWMGEDR